MQMFGILKHRKVGAYAILEENGKYLLVQEKVGGIRGLWGLPGGGVEKGESIERAAEREAEEEIGYDIELTRKIGEYKDKKRFSTRHVFVAKIIGGELKIDESELMDARWFTLKEIEEIKANLRGEWVWDSITDHNASKK